MIAIAPVAVFDCALSICSYSFAKRVGQSRGARLTRWPNARRPSRGIFAPGEPSESCTGPARDNDRNPYAVYERKKGVYFPVPFRVYKAKSKQRIPYDA